MEALAGSHQVLVPRDWPSLRSAVAGDAVAVCLVDGDHPDRSRASRHIADLRDRFPDVGVVAFVESVEPDGYYQLGELGVDSIVVAGARAIQTRANVDFALTMARARQVQRILEKRVAAPGPRAVAWAIEHAGPDTSVERLASALGMTARALRDATHDAGLPSPTRLLVWGRLLLAGARLGDDGRRVEDVAFSLGYSTSTALGRAMKVHTGLTAAAVSRRGGLDTVLSGLLSMSGGGWEGPCDGPERTGDDGDPAEEGPRRPGDGRRRSGGAGKRSVMARLTLGGYAIILAGCASFGGSPIDRGPIDDALDTTPVDQMHFGILAVDAATGRTLYSHNAHRKFVPASNQKILVTATALSLMGPNYRFRTEVWATGELEGSFLDGDLVVVGSGDPSLSARYWESGTAALDAIADSLRNRGLTYIAGSSVVDVSAWDSTTVGPTWEVEDLRYSYGSTGGAFAIDEGEVEIIVSGGAAPGAPAGITWSPVGTENFVQSRLTMSPADSAIRVRPSYLPESRRLVLDGTVGENVMDTLSFALRDPVRQATAALSNALARSGIEVEGGWRVRWTEVEAQGRGCMIGTLDECEGAHRVFVLESPPLSEIVAGILEPSQNWMTEQLVRSLGARYGEEGSWNEGVDIVEAYLVNEVGVPPLDISSRDGSGLSAYNLVTPRAVVRILREMSLGAAATEYRAALAEPGEEGSTLEERLLDLEGRLFAKTGTISNVNSLSGYLVRDDGQEIIFSVLTNGSGLSAPPVRQAIDEVVRNLAH
jgi:serine-type D-Ala-D-Ala carboxypeptidase/endopeptidase (penicillin-binding protein 4)